MRGIRGDHKRFAALAAIFGLLLQAMLPALPMPALAKAAAPASISISEDGLQTLIICTGDGIKRITIDAYGNPVGSPEELPAKTCPICHALAMAPVAAPPAAIVLPLPAFAHLQLRFFEGQGFICGGAPRRASVRDPPVQTRSHLS